MYRERGSERGGWGAGERRRYTHTPLCVTKTFMTTIEPVGRNPPPPLSHHCKHINTSTLYRHAHTETHTTVGDEDDVCAEATVTAVGLVGFDGELKV